MLINAFELMATVVSHLGPEFLTFLPLQPLAWAGRMNSGWQSLDITGTIPSPLGIEPVPLRNQTNALELMATGHVPLGTGIPYTLILPGLPAVTTTFLAVPLGCFSAILGQPWLTTQNPQIDWCQRVLKFPSGEVLQAEQDVTSPNCKAVF